MLSRSSTFVPFANKLIQEDYTTHTIIIILHVCRSLRKQRYKNLLLKSCKWDTNTHNTITGVTHHMLINLHFPSKIMIGKSNTPSTAPDVSKDGGADVITRVRQGPLLPDTVVGKRVG